MRRSAGQPWYGNVRERLRFERGARLAHPSLCSAVTGRGARAIVRYQLTVPVPYYEARKLEIQLYNSTAPAVKAIFADGPSESPHRYGDGSLCVWRPDDPPEWRWVADDGLLDLITYTQHHLFFEAYWRETAALDEGEWLGDEAPHTPLRTPNRRARRAAR
jgi:hypothetical protein